MHFDNCKYISGLIGLIWLCGFIIFPYFYSIFKEAREAYRFNKALTLLALQKNLWVNLGSGRSPSV
jgi:hypothetical protein